MKTYEIHPAIGVARLGLSPDYFIGPEPDGVFPPPLTTNPDGSFKSMRDANGLLRPQATRFRVFEVERQGSEIIKTTEVSSSEALITWQVHVVNRKAAAPCFAAADGTRNTDPARRRNNAKDTDDPLDPTNKNLIINPGTILINNISNLSSNLVGSFKTLPVQLARISVEPATGRLLFVGGRGNSGTVPTGGTLGANFADNDGWYDDTCDGTVEATLYFKDGSSEKARPAWVVSCAYDFCPEVKNIVTIYDLLFEMACDKNQRAIPSTVYYDQHILPFLHRIFGYQWINATAAAGHGKGAPADFLAWKGLDDPTSTDGAKLRQEIVASLRAPGTPGTDAYMPKMFSNDYPNDPSVMWMTRPIYAILKLWADGKFETKASLVATETLAEALTRMQLEACVGRPLWPGIEISIRIYDPTIFYADDPFRIDITKLQPGQLTQSMSLPWQSDFLDCDEETQPNGDQKYWWPAARPNSVIPAGTTARRDWAEGIVDGMDMVNRWHQLGVVRKLGQDDTQNEIERLIK